MRGGAYNPTGGREVLVTIKCPKQEKRIKELEALLSKQVSDAQLGAVQPAFTQVNEVVREVVKEDASLITKLNDAHRQLAILRGELAMRKSISPMPPEIREVEKEVLREIVHIKRVINKKAMAIAVAVSLSLGGAVGYVSKPAKTIEVVKEVLIAPKKR